MCKMDLALNNLQWLIYHKTKPNQANFKCNFAFVRLILNSLDSSSVHIN